MVRGLRVFLYTAVACLGSTIRQELCQGWAEVLQVKGDGSTRFPTVDDLGVEIVWCTLVTLWTKVTVRR